MSISLDKLKALRRQAGHAHTPPEPVTPIAETTANASEPARETSVFGWTENIRHKPASPVPRVQDGDALRRLLATRNRALPAPRAERSGPVDRDLPGTEIAPGLHLIEAFLPQPIPTQPLSLAFGKRPDETVAPHDLLFFDTETTGLAGGTGTRAFMIGAADWHHHATHGEGLRVRQLLMATLGAERAMLEAFAGWLAPATVLSSYNGRCYDAPLLKTRYRLARHGDPISALDHVDLLFPTRRRYRGTWENCRLATIERQLLRIQREDDLPGSEAPAAWLDYLRGGSARNLRRVGEHNHQDVVTLAQLFLRLVQAEADERAAPALQAER
ncbi:MAG: ribonuclease H-like domain-containing protein [Stenotrophomonas sp.]